MANDLSDAMADAIAEDATFADLFTGGVWSDFAPPKTAPPYVVVKEIGESSAYSSEAAGGATPYIDSGQIQISIFVEDSKTLAKQYGERLEAFLNDRPFTFDTGYLMKLRRSFHATAIDPSPFRDGHYLFQRIVTFDTTVGRTT